MEYRKEELLICAVARLLEGIGHIAVGVASPIPGSASLLVQALSEGRTCVSMLNSRRQYFTNGSTEIFDMAAQGRLDAFFLGGGQIDGQANINLVGVGDYPQQEVRWSGSFGSAFLYFMVPRVILFREEHTTRVMVPKVDFVSAPGTSPPGVHRPGGPHAMVTGRCVFSFDKQRERFRLESVHPGQSVEDVLENTGFEFDLPDHVPTTPEPEPERLALVRGQVARQVAEAYPQFAAEVFGIEAAA
ncbi:MAG: CoA-transferase [Alphaproteobacteria bacterium]|nr:CoA synthetase [Rhodospirillaceae bacterium]MDP6407207.1 CoA-transferase [Alphaproteobacteria bacterium]MDP6621973.1 CoA-transferase [Alphaproteobacteria bacterium]